MKSAANLKQKYSALNAREKRALSVLAVFIAVFLVYNIIWKPTVKWVEKGQASYQEKLSDYNWMAAHENEAKAIVAKSQNQKPGDDSSILAKVDSSASAFKIPLKKIESEDTDKVHIWTEDAVFDQVLLWLDNLGKDGIIVKQIHIERQDQPGAANLNIILMKP